MPSRSGWARSGSRTASTAPSPGSIPPTDTVRAAIPVGDGPNGIAVAAGAVWVSNELSGTLSRIDPDRDAVVETVKTGNRPQGLVLDAGALFVAVRASGAGHRGGTLTVLTRAATCAAATSTRPVAYTQTEWQVVVLTNDGLTGFRRVGGSAGTRLVPDLAVSLPDPDRRRPVVHLPAAPGHPLLERGDSCGREDFRRAIERGLALAGRHARPTTPASSAPALPGAQKKPCDLSTGDRDRPLPRTPSPSTSRARPRLPVQARAPLRVRGARRDAAPSPWPRACDRPLQDRLVRSRSAGMRLVRNPRFREWSPRPSRAGSPTRSSSASRARRTRTSPRSCAARPTRVRRLERGHAVAGRARVGADATRRPAQAQSLDDHLVPRLNTRFRRSTTSQHVGR